MSAEIQAGKDEYWIAYIQAMRERLANSDDKEHKLIEMLHAGLAQELAGLDIFSASDALAYAAELLAAWQQIIEEVTS